MKYKYLTVFRLGLVFDETGFLLIRYSDFCHSLKVIELRFFHNETILFYKSEIWQASWLWFDSFVQE